ncbi:MAG: DNA polymerase III subunit gamma/tau, partial [Alphaproteobacteria bacterium]|nr:DNA polymerase III subunit gamma/tau [Alphaproteobacteria bacterium]
MSDVDPSPDGPPWEEDAPDGDVVERDPDTDDMFGAPEPAGMREAEAAATPVAATAPPPADVGPAAHADDGSAYTVLARKYRPHAFEDLIGQEAMVRTLTNAFATGRIA